MNRAGWESAADRLLDGLLPYRSPSGAFYHPPGRPSRWGEASDGLEGYARSFLLAAFRIAGGGGHPALVERYGEGLAAGTGGEWPALGEPIQTQVEAASVAIGLTLTRPWLWNRLDARAQEDTVRWLSGVHGCRYGHNNWLLFNVMVNAFLKQVGAPYRQADVDAHLAAIDSMYRADGWYSDGPGQSFDHYNGWAIHFYTALLAYTGAVEPDRYRARLRSFLEDHAHLFGADGAPLFQGRSLTYRFAAAAPLWAGVLVGATPLRPGETRAIASRCVAHFLDRIHADTLPLGWYGEFPPMVQDYSCPGSAYWASKAFVGLLVPPDDPEWTSSPQPPPSERGDFVRAMPAPGWLAIGSQADGTVRVCNHGSDHHPLRSIDPALYTRLAYSTAAGPDLCEDAADSQVALVAADGTASVRTRIHRLEVSDVFAASVQYPHEPEAADRIETVSVGIGPAEVRVHHVSASAMCTLRDGGFALASDEPPETIASNGHTLVRRADGTWSAVWALHGFDRSDVVHRKNANAFGTFSATPLVTTSGTLPAEGVYVSLVALAGPAVDLADVRASVASVEVSGREVTIRGSDGTGYVVRLVQPDRGVPRFSRCVS